MVRRHIEPALRRALADTRVVLLNGARQTGKSTLAHLVAADLKGRYLSLDDESVLRSARADALQFVRLPGLTVIDEVQKAPELFGAIKLEVDRDQRPGRFLLTGSANVLLLPQISESLAGRLEILPLHPLSQDELIGAAASFPDALFSDTDDPWRIRARHAVDRVDICARAIRGGFPEPDSAERRGAWFRSYLSSLLQRDIRDLAHIEGLTEMPHLLGLLAARLTSLMNMSELSRATGIAHSTLRRYLTLLEATFILQPLPAWSTNLGKRLVKSPKVHLVDSGLAAHLRGDTEPSQLAASPAIGPLLESFVLQEIRKQLGWSRRLATPYHFRTTVGREVDIVLEAPGGYVTGIEVKASASVDARDFAGLEALASASGGKFVRGVVLYMGDYAAPFGDRMWAVPIDELWQPAS